MWNFSWLIEIEIIGIINFIGKVKIRRIIGVQSLKSIIRRNWS